MWDIRELMSGKLTSTAEIGLRKQAINNQSPGPLLANIACLINAIGDGVPTTSAYFALPQGRLAELNESLVDPLPHELKRPQLRSFPTLMGLLMLLRNSGLAVGETKPKRVLLIDPAMLAQWQSLNPTEQYLALLTLFVYETSWDCVGVEGHWSRGMLNDILSTYLVLKDRVTEIGDDRFWQLHRLEGAVAVSLLHQMGWIRVKYQAKPNPGKAANLREIERTQFGDAMFVATCQMASYEDQMPAAVRTKLQKCFPNWKKMLIEPTARYREGLHVFKVSIGKIWRRIEAPADVNLEQIANAILKAYQFDHEHLYQFELCDLKGRRINIVGPYVNDSEYFAEETRVGDVPLLVGDSMVFHYDFGDDWRFKVTLESVDETSAVKTKTLNVIGKSGDAPIQYDRGDW